MAFFVKMISLIIKSHALKITNDTSRTGGLEEYHVFNTEAGYCRYNCCCNNF